MIARLELPQDREVCDEPDGRLDLLHENVRKYGTVFNTVAPGTELTGALRRKSESP
jgi:hypothetical protein